MCESLILLGLFLKKIRYIEPGIFRDICKLTGYKYKNVEKFTYQNNSRVELGTHEGYARVTKDVSNPISPHYDINLKPTERGVEIETEYRTWIGKEIKKEIRTIKKIEILFTSSLGDLEYDIYEKLTETLARDNIDGVECDFQLEVLDIAEETIYDYITKYVSLKLCTDKTDRKCVTRAYRSAKKVHRKVENSTNIARYSKELQNFIDITSVDTSVSPLVEEKRIKSYEWSKTASIYIPSSCPTLSICREHRDCEHIAINGKCAVNWTGCCRGYHHCYGCWDSDYGDKCHGLDCECMQKIFQN